MTGLCGWLTAGPPGVARPEDVLSAMVAGLPAFGADNGHYHVEPAAIGSSAHAAIHAHGNGADVARSDDLIVGIEGYPRWTVPALAKRAEDVGHADALLNGMEQYGLAVLDHLRGQFAIAIVERRSSRLTLAVDRLGVSSLCWAAVGNGLVFGATTSSVRAHPAVSTSISFQSIHDFFCVDVVMAPATIYAEISKLLPAQRLTFEAGRVQREFYWQMPYRTDGPRDVTGLSEELHRLLRQAVRRCLDAEDPGAVGAFLSGGLDSSTVAGLLAEEGGRGAKTFTIGFDENAFDEMEYARCATEHFGTEQHQYTLTADDAVALLPRLAEAYDEPFANSSAVPAYYCARMARDLGTDCLLAGDGGDELFGGNKRYVHQKIFNSYQHLPEVLRKRLVEPVAFAVDSVPYLLKLARFIRTSNEPMPERMRTDDPFRKIDRGDVLTGELLAAVDHAAIDNAEREVFERTASTDIVQRMMHLDLQITLADNDLRKVSRMCMLADIGVRYPLLDDDLVEFSARVPPEVMIRRFKLRSFYKAALSGWLPQKIIDKKKHGFGMPYDDWPRTNPQFRELSHDCCRTFRDRGYLRPEFVDRLDPTVGGEDVPKLKGMLWSILVLELWLRADEQKTVLRAAS